MSVSSRCRNLHKQFIFMQSTKYLSVSYPVQIQFDMIQLSRCHTNKKISLFICHNLDLRVCADCWLMLHYRKEWVLCSKYFKHLYHEISQPKAGHIKGISDIQVYFQPQKKTILQLQKYIFCWSSVDDGYTVWWETKTSMEIEGVSNQAVMKSHQRPAAAGL